MEEEGWSRQKPAWPQPSRLRMAGTLLPDHCEIIRVKATAWRLIQELSGTFPCFALSSHTLFFSMSFYSWHTTWVWGVLGFFVLIYLAFSVSFFFCWLVVFFFLRKGTVGSVLLLSRLWRFGLHSSHAVLQGHTAPIRDTCLRYNKAEKKDYFYSARGDGGTEAAHIPFDWKHFKASDTDIRNC